MVEITSTIRCQKRTAAGKGMAHKLRATGMAPAIAYGPSSEPRLLALDPKQFNMQRRAFGSSYIYDVDVDGATGFKALIKDVQIDPLTRHILHVDLYEVDMTKDIYVEVPIEVEGKPAGVIEGGLLSQVLRSVEVKCLPGVVPSKLVVDVSHLNVGDVLHTDAIELPEGVSLTLKRPEAVAAVTEPETDETAAAAAAEGEVSVESAAPAESEAPAEAEEKKGE
jgi:large subunit ribosomal protein L25